MQLGILRAKGVPEQAGIGRAEADVIGNVVDGGFENQSVSGEGVPSEFWQGS